MRHLHSFILAAGTSLTPTGIQEEIAWRERSHGIDKYSAYASESSGVAVTGMPSQDSDMLPPLVTSIQHGTVASFPLRFNHADAYIGENTGSRTVLVGDAAHTIHPLAGQGLNMGLGDVESLTRCIQDAVLQGGDIGQLGSHSCPQVQ
jgi:ubiquinone biosynthesis monooxygenase Coq6